MVSRWYWFLFQHYFSEFSTKNPFLGKFGPKQSKLFVFPKSTYTWYLEGANSYSNISFMNFQLKIQFWANLGKKFQICLFCLKMNTHGVWRMWILIPTLVFWISKPKSTFWQSYAQEAVNLPVLSDVVTQRISRVKNSLGIYPWKLYFS